MLRNIGMRLRKEDILNFIYGIFLAIILVLFVYLGLKQNTTLKNSDFFPLLVNGKGTIIYYFFIGLLQELIFRGLVLGLFFKKVKNIYIKIIASALIFAIPHIFMAGDISKNVIFIFALLYGVVSSEMFVFTKSIWMSTGFLWIFNYTTSSIFLTTGTQNLIYIWIITEMFILIPLLYCGFKKLGLTLDNIEKT